MDAVYAVQVSGNIVLYGKKLRVNKSNMDKKTLDVGANIFVSNLAPEVDENMLKTVFMAFGQFACEPKVNHFPLLLICRLHVILRLILVKDMVLLIIHLSKLLIMLLRV